MSAVELQNAVNDLKKLSAWFRGIVEVGPALERLVSLEQAAAEAEARRKQSDDKLQKLVARIVAADSEVHAAEERASQAKAQAEKATADAASTVESNVRLMLNQAEIQAARITAEAEVDAAALVAKAREANQARADDLKKVEAMIAQKQDVLNSVTESEKTAQARLAQAKRHFEELRAKL